MDTVQDFAEMLNAGPKGSEPQSGPRAALLGECRGLILDRLNDVVAQALSRISEDLTAEALRAKRYDHKLALLEAVMLVRENRRELEERFRESFGSVYERLLNPNADHWPAPALVSLDDLSLVSDDQVADRIQIDRLIMKARAAIDPQQTLGVRARLGALVEKDWFDESRHPVAPEAIFEALRMALQEVSTRPEIQSALLDAFEPYFSNNLNGIYQAVNDLLKTNHILPQIKPTFVTDGPTNRGAVAPAEAGGASTGASTGASSGAAGIDSAWTTASIDRLQKALNSAYSGRSSGLTQMAQILANPAMLATDRLPMQPVWAPLVDSLTELQQGNASGPNNFSFPELTQQVRDQGAPIDLITVEIVGMVFDYIYNDRRLPDSIKHQLLRLQVVAVKAALLDRGFFARRHHPLRQLIDRISDVGADPDFDSGSASPMLAGFDALLTEVIGTFNTDLQVFQDAIEKVEAIEREELARHADCLDSTSAVAARVEAEQFARDDARAAIEQRLNKKVPAYTRDFLLETWSSAMARARVNQADDIDSYVWDLGLKSAEYLIWSVLPKRRDDIPRLASILPGLIRGLNKGLDLIEFDPQARSAFFDVLMKTHTQEITAAKQRASHSDPDPVQMPISILADGTIRFVPNEKSQNAVLPENDQIDELLGGLKRGDRIEVAGEFESRLFKLAWVSPARTLYILSRHPDDSMTLQGSELASLLHRGLARVMSDESALDRAITSVASESTATV
jgi:Protein of unknown function (DUF1631)